MNKIKRAFSSAFKAKVALDLIRGTETIAQACSRHGIHPTQAGLWKSQLLKGSAAVFDNKPILNLKGFPELTLDLQNFPNCT